MQQRVLIIDEHAGSRAILNYELGALGFDCVSFATVAAALAEFDDVAPHIVIYDWSPRREGCAGLARTLRDRAASRGRALRIIAVSVLEEPNGFVHAEAVDAFFTKPLQLRQVAAALHTAATQLRHVIVSVSES